MNNNLYEEFFKEFDKEVKLGSDRSIALVAVSVLDELLRELLMDNFIEDDKLIKEVFSVKGALGQFDDKIKLAFVMGKISKVDYDLLIKIQKVRNKFAHKVLGVSFEENDIKNLCSTITLPKNAYIPRRIAYKKTLYKIELNPIKKDTSTKKRFLYAFEFVFGNIFNRRAVEYKGKPSIPKDVVTKFEILEKFIVNTKKLERKAIELSEEELLNELREKKEHDKKLIDIINYQKKLVEFSETK